VAPVGPATPVAPIPVAPVAPGTPAAPSKLTDQLVYVPLPDVVKTLTINCPLPVAYDVTGPFIEMPEAFAITTSWSTVYANPVATVNVLLPVPIDNDVLLVVEYLSP
jgi:hypothetical protein